MSAMTKCARRWDTVTSELDAIGSDSERDGARAPFPLIERWCIPRSCVGKYPLI